MWQLIRKGVRWRMTERYGLAVRGLDLSTVKSIKISLNPFHKDTLALRKFWMTLSTAKVKSTNPQMRVTHEIRNDRLPPYFDAQLSDNRRIIFETAKLDVSDVLMRFNRLLGNPEFGKAGLKPRT